MGCVEHERHFCNATSHPCEGGNESEVVGPSQAKLYSHAHLLKAMKREAHSEPTMSFIQWVALVYHFHMLTVAKREEFVPKSLPVMNYCSRVRI